MPDDKNISAQTPADGGHERYAELISAHIDGNLTQAEEAELSAHLESCPECRELMDILTGVHELLDAEVDPPEELYGNVMSRIEAEKRRRARSARRRFAAVFGSLAAAAVLAVVMIPSAVGGGKEAADMMDATESPSAYIMSPRDCEPAPVMSGQEDGFPLPDDEAAADDFDAPGTPFMPGGSVNSENAPEPDADNGLPCDLPPADPESSALDYCGGTLAAAWFDDLPDSAVEAGLLYVEFSDGSGWVVPGDVLEDLLPDAARVELPEVEWEYGLALVEDQAR